MTKNVLIVDDVFFDAVLTMQAMRDCAEQFTFCSAGDGVEALRLLRINQYELILLDLKMPRVDGFEVLASLHEDLERRLVPIFVLSNSTILADRERSLSLGATEYVTKDLDYSAFRAGLKAALVRQGFCQG